MNIFEGRTQIESWEMQRVKSLTKLRRWRENSEELLDIELPYDIDPITNFIDAWGNPLFWMWPWAKSSGYGLHFEKNEAADNGAVWPPDHRDQLRPTAPPPSQFTSGQIYTTLGYARKRRNSVMPEWRRGLKTSDDFYKPDQWQSFEGEKISDFGVDIETVRYQNDEEGVPLGVLYKQKA